MAKKSQLQELLLKKKKQSESTNSFVDRFPDHCKNLWTHQHHHNFSTAYNMAYAFRFDGGHEAKQILSASANLFLKIPALRLSLGQGDIPKYIELTEFDKNIVINNELASEKECIANFNQISNSPIPLINTPTFFLYFRKTLEGNWIVLFLGHHLFLDGPSMNKVVEIFFKLLAGHKDLKKFQPPKMPKISDQVFAEELKFWKNQLRDFELLDLSDTPIRGFDSFKGEKILFSLDQTEKVKIDEFCRKFNITPFSFFITLYAICLKTFTNRDALYVQVPVNVSDDFDNSIGNFINTLFWKFDFSKKKVSELMIDTFMFGLEALTNKDVSTIELLNIIESQGSIFKDNSSALFTFQPYITSKTYVDSYSPVELNLTSAKNLFLMSVSDGDGYGGFVEFNSSFLSHSFAKRFIDLFKSTIERILQDESSSVDDLLQMSSDQIEANARLLKGELVQIKDCNIAELFIEKVADFGNVPAVFFADEFWSYLEFHQLTNSLAARLDSILDPGEPVLIVMSRSPEMMLAIFSCIKANLPYTPIQMDAPSSYFKSIHDELQFKVVLTIKDSPAIEAFKDSTEIEVIPIDYRTLKKKCEYTVRYKSPLLYTLYTSGSTGNPKGVRNTHLGLINRLEWMKKNVGIQEGDAVLQKTSYSFDVSFWEYFLPLISGASVNLLPAGMEISIDDTWDYINKSDISLLHFVPSVLDNFLNSSKASDGLKKVKSLVVSGEALRPSTVKRLRYIYKGRLLNYYGPTEAAIDVSYHEVPCADVEGQIPIGKPIWNTSLYVLDEKMRLVRPGQKGEIYIAGIGVSPGYVNNEISRKSFLENPYEKFDGFPKIYKSGDMGFYDLEGNIYFAGRVDNQIKLRGQRIEVNEIIGAIDATPGVSNSYVNVFRDVLVVFYVSELEIDENDFISHLKNIIPLYMIPNLFIRIKDLPLTSHGKLNLKKLSEIFNSFSNTHETYCECTDFEKELLAIINKYTPFKINNLNKNVMSLGLHSLQIVQVIRDIKEKFGKAPPVNKFYSMITLSELSLIINDLDSSPNILGSVNVDEEILLYPTPTQRIILSNYSSQEYHFGQKFELSFEKLDFDRFVAATKAVLESQPVFSVVINQGIDSLLYRPDLPINLVINKEGGIESYERSYQNLSKKGFEVGESLYQFNLFYLGRKSIGVTFFIHHVIFDGWSNVEFFNQLLHFYHEGELLESKENYLKTLVQNSGQNIGLKLNKKIRKKRSLGEIKEEYPLPNNDFQRLLSKEVCFSAFFNALKLCFVNTEEFNVAIVSNGRKPEYISPFLVMGLFWNFYPLSVRSSSTQEEVLEQFRNSYFGSTSMEEINKCLFSFNYIHFTNSEFQEKFNLNYSGVESRDYYHFPLNVNFRIKESEKKYSIYINWDKEHYTQQLIVDFINYFRRELARCV